MELQRPTPSDPGASHHLDYLQQTGHCILITDFSLFSFDTLAKICASFSSEQVTLFTKCCLLKILSPGHSFQPIALAPAIIT